MTAPKYITSYAASPGAFYTVLSSSSGALQTAGWSLRPRVSPALHPRVQSGAIPTSHFFRPSVKQLRDYYDALDASLLRVWKVQPRPFHKGGDSTNGSYEHLH